MAQSTHRTYNTGQQHYLRFCQHTGLNPIPAREHQFMLFAAYLALRGLKWQSIKTFSAVHHSTCSGALRVAFLMALTHSFNSCYVPSKRQLQRPCSPSYHSSYPSTGLASTSPLPSHRECADDLGGHDHLFLWVPAGRRGVNPTATSFNPSWLLCTGYIALDSHATPTKLFITIKPSKTDPFREGVTITLGKTGLPLCPMTFILPYIARRGAHPGPLFCFREGSFLTRERFVREVRRLLTALHPIPVTVFALVLQLLLGLQTLGRWKSSAYQLYIRIP